MTQEALKLALDALQFALHVGFDESSESQIKKGDKAGQQHRKAITAIKEALAEHAMQEVQRLGQEIEQESVTTLEDLEQEIYENTRQFVSHDVMEWMLKRYYTTPPQRKPLTVQEMFEAIRPLYSSEKDARIAVDISEDEYRAIEAAHGIKENT